MPMTSLGGASSFAICSSVLSMFNVGSFGRTKKICLSSFCGLSKFYENEYMWSGWINFVITHYQSKSLLRHKVLLRGNSLVFHVW